MENTKKILLVIDVQNCFIAGGSLGGSELINSINQMKEIETLIDKNEFIVFTRDYHPNLHASLSLFPAHCRNKNRTCNSNNSTDNSNLYKNTKIQKSIQIKSIIETATDTIKTELNKINYKYFDNLILGTELSYLYYITKYAHIINILNKDKIQKHTIGLNNSNKCSHKGEPNLNDINLNIVALSSHYNKHFIQLTKGEYCNYDSYSAFNYHITYDNTIETNENNYTNYSTGLMEYILDFYKTTDIPITLEITICGLVGNICVMHTAIEGSYLWNKYYKNTNTNITVKFIYQLMGTHFLLDINDNLKFGTFNLSYDNNNFNKNTFLNYFKTKIPQNDITNISFDIKYGDNQLLEFSNTNTNTNTNTNIVTGGGSIKDKYYYKYIKYKTKYLKLNKLLN